MNNRFLSDSYPSCFHTLPGQSFFRRVKKPEQHHIPSFLPSGLMPVYLQDHKGICQNWWREGIFFSFLLSAGICNRFTIRTPCNLFHAAERFQWAFIRFSLENIRFIRKPFHHQNPRMNTWLYVSTHESPMPVHQVGDDFSRSKWQSFKKRFFCFFYGHFFGE